MTTSTNDATYHLFVGVDIAATTAKVSWLVPGAAPTRALTIEQTLEGFRALEQRLLSMGHPASSILAVMEAMGSYWISLATTLTHVGFAVSVINPAQAHQFARALLKRGKLNIVWAKHTRVKTHKESHSGSRPLSPPVKRPGNAIPRKLSGS